MKNLKRLFLLAALIVLAVKVLSSDFDKKEAKDNNNIVVVDK